MTPMFRRLFDGLDARTGIRVTGQRVTTYVFPRHWTFLLGEVALFLFGVLVLTGIFLTMFYRPSIEPVEYTGAATIYQGRELPAAFESVTRISHDVPGGLFVRRVHRATAQLFVGVIVLHFLRVLLTGAFRRPREFNYQIGLLLLLLAMAAGYSGHNLPFDVLAGTSLRILYSFLQSVPFVGEALAQFVFGGEFPTGQLIPRLFIMHVLVLPALMAGLMGLHVALIVRESHTQPRRRGVDASRTKVGVPFWPAQFGQTTTLAIALSSLIAFSAVLVPWSDMDLHGPYLIARATNASQPDWYLFWVEGALRLYPGIEIHVLGTVVSGPFLVGVVLPLSLFGLLMAYPWMERRVTKAPDRPEFELQHPLAVPFRVGFVTVLFTALLVLNITAGHDVLARLLQAPIETVTRTLQILLFVAPAATGTAATLYARRRRRTLRDGLAVEARR